MSALAGSRRWCSAATVSTLAASSASTRPCPRATSHSRCVATRRSLGSLAAQSPPPPPPDSRPARCRLAPPQGKGNFYDLETLLFFAKHVDAKFTDYFKKAGKEIGKAVTFVDRKVRAHRRHGQCWLSRSAGSC